MNKYEDLLQGQQDYIKNDLIKGLTEQQTYIDNSLKERDKLLMQSINELMESKRQAAAEKEEEKKGFFLVFLTNRDAYMCYIVVQ